MARTKFTPREETTQEKGERHMNRLSLFGAAALGAYVYKLGRGWVVEMDGSATPTVFKTKTEALKHAEARIYAMVGRFDLEPYMYDAAVRPQRWTSPVNWD